MQLLLMFIIIIKSITIVRYLLCSNHYVNIYVRLDMLCTGVCVCARTHPFLPIYKPLVYTIAFERRYYHYHVIDEAIKAQRSEVICSRLHSCDRLRWD